MLSYRHAFHAGNHADVLKHFVLDQVLSYTTQKDKPFWYIDTHAGAGLYQLNKGYATQNAEFEAGIALLANDTNLPDAIAAYVDTVKNLNPNNQLDFYPGSPMIAKKHVRIEDEMRLFELHSSDCKLLIENFKGYGKQVKIEASDGFSGLKANLPPSTKRAVILIDPPYEEKQDYLRVVNAIKDSLMRFETGTYLVWYPLLQRAEPLQMIESLQQLPIKNWLNVSLNVNKPSAEGFGMFGSGMFIINPPWTLPKTLKETLPYFVEMLGQDSSASYNLESQIS